MKLSLNALLNVPHRALQAVTPEQRAQDLICEGNRLEDVGRADDALRTYDAAVRAAPEFARAHLNRGNALLALGRDQDAEAAFVTAVAKDPKYAGAHYNLGNLRLRSGRPEAARSSYEHAITLDPQFVDAYVALGVAMEQLGRDPDAAHNYRRALAIKPDYAAASVNLGDVLRRLGEGAAAAQAYQEAIAHDPGAAVAHCRLGDLDQETGRLDTAVECYRRALAADPELAIAHNHLGNALASLGRFEEAIASYRRALQMAPDYADALCNLGSALKDTGNAEGALAHYRRALDLRPAFPEALSNMGNVLKDRGRFADALAYYDKALAISPGFAEAHYNRANVLHKLGRPGEAMDCYERALTLRPGSVDVFINMGNALTDMGRGHDAAASYRRALEVAPEHAMARSNLLFAMSHDDAVPAELLFQEHCRYGELLEAPRRATWPKHVNTRDPERRLRVGFVSGDLRNHPVANFVEPVLRHLTAAPSLALYAYHSHGPEDHVSARLRPLFVKWRNVSCLGDDAVVQSILEDEIDVLVDLSGHTSDNRLLAFACKPAPVQASWIGYPGTTGLQAMDYYFADPHFLPVHDFATQFTEQLALLPANAPFLPASDAPALAPLPALARGYFTFGSFNRRNKLSQPVIALWARILRELPKAHLLLGGMNQEGEEQLLLSWFAAEGIPQSRLSLHARCGMRDYLALHSQVDLCLDTFPYAGGTTTSYALWMGVPTLTLAGRTPAARQGAAILGQVGLHEFITYSPDDFVATGVRLSENTEMLRELRAGLRDRYEQSPLRRPDLIASGLERAFRQMWERWCAGLPPATIDVSRIA